MTLLMFLFNHRLKAEKLQWALESVGRTDLAEELDTMNRKYKEDSERKQNSMKRLLSLHIRLFILAKESACSSLSSSASSLSSSLSSSSSSLLSLFLLFLLSML